MRTVFIGKGRRITLEELDIISYCDPGTVSTQETSAVLEFVASVGEQGGPMDHNNNNNNITIHNTLVEVQDVMTDAVLEHWLDSLCKIPEKENDAADQDTPPDDTLDDFLTPVESRAALTLVANFCAQQRHGTLIALCIIHLLNGGGKKGSKTQTCSSSISSTNSTSTTIRTLRMSRNGSTFIHQLQTWISSLFQRDRDPQTLRPQEEEEENLFHLLHSACQRIIPLAIISMATMQLWKLVKHSTLDGLASLSVEHVAALMATTSTYMDTDQDTDTDQDMDTATTPQDLIQMFADTHYDIHRPHRGMMNSASVLRVCIQGSKLGASASSAIPEHSHPTLSKNRIHAIQRIPAYHGPITDAISSAVKVLELECNCFESQTVHRLDPTIINLTCDTVTHAVQILIPNTLRRMGRIYPSKTTSTTSTSIITPLANADMIKDIHFQAYQLSTSIQQLYSILIDEAKMNVTFMEEEIVKASDMAKKKSEEKAARAAEIMATSVSTHHDKESTKEEFEGMTEAQKQKILKKRAEKEAKAAKKKASKAQGDGVDVSIFGSGSIHIMNILKDHNYRLSEPVVISALDETIAKLLSGGVQRKPKIAKGTRDYLPEQMMIRDQAFQIIRRVFKSHGAVEIDTPVFELKDTLTGKYGEDSKLIYDLADQGGELLALRYDLTVPFARFLALNNVGNIKRFHIGKVYRRDQPQLSKGRYREFYQCDFDIAGTYGRMVPDSECLCVATEILSSLPIGDFGIKLNHRRLLDAILDLCGVPSDKFRTICSAVDKLDKEPWETVKKEMVDDKGLKEDVADKIGVFVVQKGEPWQMYHSLMENAVFGNHKGALEALEDLRILFSYLEAMGKLKYFSFDLSLARGLDYYTGVIYEAVCMNGNTQVGSIGGGGRYDNLVSMFQEAGKITPCVGVSVGIERVFTLMEERLRQQHGGSIKQPNVSVLVAQAGENMMLERMKVSKLLWDSNISAEFNQQENPKLKYEIANALDRSIPFMVVIGEDEAKEGKCRVKDLNARTEDIVDQSQLVSILRAKGVIPVGCEFAAEFLKSQNS